MAYSDNIRDADVVTLDIIADLIDALLTSTGPLTWTSYVPTFGIEGTGTLTWDPVGSVTYTAKYLQIGKLLMVHIRAYDTAGGTTVTGFTATIPADPADTQPGQSACAIYQGGATTPAAIGVAHYNGSSVMHFHLAGGGDIAPGAVRGFNWFGAYRVA